MMESYTIEELKAYGNNQAAHSVRRLIGMCMNRISNLQSELAERSRKGFDTTKVSESIVQELTCHAALLRALKAINQEEVK